VGFRRGNRKVTAVLHKNSLPHAVSARAESPKIGLNTRRTLGEPFLIRRTAHPERRAIRGSLGSQLFRYYNFLKNFKLQKRTQNLTTSAGRWTDRRKQTLSNRLRQAEAGRNFTGTWRRSPWLR